VKDKISKSNASTAVIHARLDAMRISGYERLQAKAHLARAEAIAEALAQIGGSIARVARTLVIRPLRRLTASFG